MNLPDRRLSSDLSGEKRKARTDAFPPEAKAGGWVNRRGGGGGGWINAASHPGGTWVNGGAGGWVNRRGGGGAWVNR